MPNQKLTEAQIQEALKLLEEHGNPTDAARKGNLTRNQLYSRLYAAKERGITVPKQEKYSRAPEYNENELKAVHYAYQQHKGNITALAKSLGITRHAGRMYLDELERAGFDTSVPEEPPEVLLENDTAILRAKEAERHIKSLYKEAQKELKRVNDKLSDLEMVAKSDAKPADWTLKGRTKKGRSEHIPMLFTSDFQVGEVIRSEETDHGVDYNAGLFVQRYRRMIESTIYLSFEHGGKAWSYPGIVYARGGDTISGAIHDELRETDDLSPIEAVELAFEEEAAGIAKLVEAFGRVDVKDCGGGNHDRVTMKPRAKGAHQNYDRLISFMLRREFKDDDRVHFQTTESMDVYFPIYGRNYLLTHGDRIGSRGGQGFVGPLATIMRGAQKVIMEQAALQRHIDCVLMGHFHTPVFLDWVIVNGCLPGYSEFAKMNRMRPSDPQQFLLYHHEDRGVVDLKPIILK